MKHHASYSKTEQERVQIHDSLNKHFLTHNLDSSAMQRIVDCMTEVKFQECQQILRQGESGSEYYIIKRGQCQVTVNNADGQQTKLKILKEGEAFGEVALLYDAVRTATVTAVTEGSLWKLDGHIFKKIIIEST